MTTCTPVLLSPGTAVLSADDLADLTIDCSTGYVLVDLQIGFPEVRPVVRLRALDDGVIDETTYLGARAVTMTLRLDHRIGSTQSLVDDLMPFLSPRRRPRLTWSLAGSPTDYRQVTIRGADAPLIIDGPKYRTVICSWLTTDAFLLDPAENCVNLDPTDTTGEVGRIYDLTFDRQYSTITPAGSLFVTNTGNAPAHWRATLNATMVDPTFSVNGIPMTFDQNGGVTIVTGQTLVIDTRERTILVNDDPAFSRYDRVNYTDWQWSDLLLQPGQNLIRIQGASFDATTSVDFCWFDTFL